MLCIFRDIIAFIITLSILITIHEFGHFWIARNCGVCIQCFSIGFGKKIWRYRTSNNTEFSIALIPLGGYIRMLDERIESVKPEMRNYAFNNKTINQRAAIIFAGPVANFILSFFIYWLVYVFGISGIRPVVDTVLPNSIAEQAKITPGMEIKSIDGVRTLDWNAVRLQTISKIGNNQTVFSVTQFGSNDTQQDKILNLKNWSFKLTEDPMITLGILPVSMRIEPVVTKIITNSAASKAGLQIGDKIIRVNDQPLMHWITFVNLIRNNLNKPLFLDIERKENIISLILIPDNKYSKHNEKEVENFSGIVPKIISLSDEYKTVLRYDFFSAIVKSIYKTWQLIQLTTQMIGKLIAGDIKLNNLSGPISIAQGARKSVSFGMISYLIFLAVVSINLGIINLFPIPILDGGHLLFLMIEKLMGKSIPKNIQDISYYIGLILLILFIGIALFNDFSR